jgi:hypothetical protein
MRSILIGVTAAMLLGAACSVPETSETAPKASDPSPTITCPETLPETINPDPASVKTAEAILAACEKKLGVLGDASEEDAKPQGNTFSDGTWRVGADIKPGTYRAAGGEGCYWARLRNFTGENDIISNSFTGSEGQATATIKPTDKGFKTAGCGTWKKI